jgi:hypothetical protein
MNNNKRETRVVMKNTLMWGFLFKKSDIQCNLTDLSFLLQHFDGLETNVLQDFMRGDRPPVSTFVLMEEMEEQLKALVPHCQAIRNICIEVGKNEYERQKKRCSLEDQSAFSWEQIFKMVLSKIELSELADINVQLLQIKEKADKLYAILYRKPFCVIHKYDALRFILYSFSRAIANHYDTEAIFRPIAEIEEKHFTLASERVSSALAELKKECKGILKEWIEDNYHEADQMKRISEEIKKLILSPDEKKKEKINLFEKEWAAWVRTDGGRLRGYVNRIVSVVRTFFEKCHVVKRRSENQYGNRFFPSTRRCREEIKQPNKAEPITRVIGI